MGDVTDRMASAPRPSIRREGSNLGSGPTAVTLAPGSADLRDILKKVEPLKDSSRFTQREVEEIMQSTMKMVGDTSIDWTKRLTMLKTFRSLCTDPTHHVQIVASLRQLFPPMEKVVKDLRSQVGREACITVAVISQQLGLRAEHFVEPLLPSLFTLLVANAKVVSLTSCATIFIVYESVPSWRLIPPLQTQMLSKSKEVRRAVCEVLKIVLYSWPTATLLKHANLIHEIVKKGLVDAEPGARVATREAFPAFQATFPALASSVLDALDPIQRRQLTQATSASNPALTKRESVPASTQGTNGSANYASLTRQGSIKKTSIPVLASRMTPVKPTTQGRSSSAIDLQAANRARQHHFSTMRTPLKYFGRTNSSMATPTNSSIPPLYKPAGPSSLTFGQLKEPGSTGTAERSRTRSRISSSQSQPGSRSNSPSSRYALKTYSPHHTSSNHHEGSPGISHLPQFGARGFRRISSTSSASSSRDTSPQGRIVGIGSKTRSRSISNSPQILSLTNNTGATAKMLLASREAESALADALRRDQQSHQGRDYSEVDYGNHSDSEDSMHSHRSYLSETFSPPATGRHMFVEDNVEDLLSKCGSAKWSERKEGLLGLQSYLQRHGSIPSQHFNRIGQTFCRIFMDAHTKVLSLFLDVLHAVLYRHARDLVDFTTILLNRILTKLGSDLLTSVHAKLMKTLEIIMEEMPADVQFSAVTHYLCDPTQTPNSRSRIAALSHIHNLCSGSITVKVNELQQLVEKILDWCVDMRSQELRRISQKVFHSLFGMAAPQMTIVLSQMPAAKQDQARTIYKNIEAQETSLNLSRNSSTSDEGAWSAINSNIQSLRISSTSGENDLVDVISQMLVTAGGKKGALLDQLYSIIKESPDSKLIDHHKDVLKVVFDALTDVGKASDKTSCFFCLEEMCSRPALNQILAAFAELFLVRVTDVHAQSAHMPREVTKAAENCGMAVAANFPPEIIARALCPIVHSKEFPVNQLAIKMLQRLCDSCELSKLRSVMGDVITTLIGAYDHPDSAVRKAAVFAIVAVHCRLGSELDPYLASLSGSKLKLLQLYIQRAEQSSAS